MSKWLRISFYLIIITGVIIAFIMWNGGEKIRWFGKKSEDVGKAIKEKSEYVGKKSDQLKEKLEDKKEAIEEKINTVVEKAEKEGIIKREKETDKEGE